MHYCSHDCPSVTVKQDTISYRPNLSIPCCPALGIVAPREIWILTVALSTKKSALPTSSNAGTLGVYVLALHLQNDL